MAPSYGSKIRESAIKDFDRLFDLVEKEDGPIVIRGLAANWPLVERGRQSIASACDYLGEFYSGAPVQAFFGDASESGKISYTDDFGQNNFKRIEADLGQVLDKLVETENQANPPTVYMGSAAIRHFLPGLADENSLPTGDREVTVRIWIGNRTKVSAHYDALDNIACVCAGRRRFTLFPPEQLPNLYVGPIDFTPAGQAISLVDVSAPDLEKYPRFAEAMRHAQSAILEPGDAVFIPSLWWHNVEGLDAFNILINHWWRQGPAYMGAPQDVLLHAILNIRDLPARQREAWKQIFDHYVFSADDDVFEHIPPQARGVLGELDDDAVRRVRALLRNKLNR